MLARMASDKLIYYRANRLIEQHGSDAMKEANRLLSRALERREQDLKSSCYVCDRQSQRCRRRRPGRRIEPPELARAGLLRLTAGSCRIPGAGRPPAVPRAPRVQTHSP